MHLDTQYKIPYLASENTNRLRRIKWKSWLVGTAASSLRSVLKALETFTPRSGKAITPSNFNPTQNPYILTGNWRLNVVNKKITYFETNFTIVHVDGTDRHTHEFTNFKRISVIPILLDSKGLTFIGMMDIKLNSGYKWFGAPVTIR
jgi:hypothetical protein